jgi:uncharacterized protein (DUF58 family)
VALRIVDRADDELPDVGLILVRDAESGEQVLVDTSDPLFRHRLADEAHAREDAVRQALRRATVPLHHVRTDTDPVSTLVEIVTSTKARPL